MGVKAHAGGATGAFGGVPYGPRDAVLGVADAGGRCPSLELSMEPRAVPLGPFCGAPYGATKRCAGQWPTHAGGAIGGFGWAPEGATKR
eukprot:9489281-Pyramimonas_sp.AAC.1